MSLDRISNMLSAIKNASAVGKRFIEMPHTNSCEEIAKIMKKEGFLSGVKSFKPKGKSFNMLRLDLSYDAAGLPAISNIHRMSRPGRRIYKSSTNLGTVRGGYGVSIVTTSRGVMTGAEAKKKKLGGEMICKVY